MTTKIKWLHRGLALGAWLPLAVFAGSIVGSVRALPPAMGAVGAWPAAMTRSRATLQRQRSASALTVMR